MTSSVAVGPSLSSFYVQSVFRSIPFLDFLKS